MSEMMIIGENDVKSLLTMKEAIQLVEKAYSELNDSKSIIFPAIREEIPAHKGIFGIKSSYLKQQKYIGLKAGGFWPGNAAKGKLNHQSTMLLFNAESGEPVCAVGANYLTGIRTGAAGAVAAKYLAKPDSKVVGIIGTGTQSRTQLEGLFTQFPIEKIAIYSRTEDGAERLSKEIIERGLAIDVCIYTHPQEVTEQADIIVTSTPSFSPIIKTSWVKSGTHINAIGSDTKGKREIEIDKKPDKMVCDLWEQCSIMGEFQHGISRNELYAEIGEIVNGKKMGRENNHEITLFDSTGLSVQDLEAAVYVYEKARNSGLGSLIHF
ncbi:ornithine cyclodeaminase family protein [Paenibacillus sp. GP183]|uniref:ornithine cyclodeaminase family protein n=1 Tax=Paenibacillus sp. GP183 TaxID=1882751 RepID=UPI0008965F35|nr:ornithine cyclodeaminase family protein [Paenibacillus sp. GP183]SEC45048.1 ornithine cyclodeaminase/alanine dehydrogenase [Paenibacillus sp. GP183]